MIKMILKLSKHGDVKDASLKAPPSLNGIVVNKKLFTRPIKDKRKRSCTWYY